MTEKYNESILNPNIRTIRIFITACFVLIFVLFAGWMCENAFAYPLYGTYADKMKIFSWYIAYLCLEFIMIMLILRLHSIRKTSWARFLAALIPSAVWTFLMLVSSYDNTSLHLINAVCMLTLTIMMLIGLIVTGTAAYCQKHGYLAQNGSCEPTASAD